MNPTEYAQAVRTALADLPVSDRDELLEDLDDHLAEIAAESDTPLEERLGSPEAYAAELRAAYGGRPAERSASAGHRLRLARATAHARLLTVPPYRQAVAFLPDLRPAWWVTRGYVLGLVVVIFATGRVRFVPDDLVTWIFVLVAAWASVWWARRDRGSLAGRTSDSRVGRGLTLALNGVAAVFVVAGLVAVAEWNGAPDVRISWPQSATTVASGFSGSQVYNIYPYARDGSALRDVLLYDQDGRPITVDPRSYGFDVDSRCRDTPQIANSYPLGLVQRDVVPAPAPCPSPSEWPSESPAPSPSEWPSEWPSESPSPAESPGDRPSSAAPSGSPSPPASPSPKADRE